MGTDDLKPGAERIQRLVRYVPLDWHALPLIPDATGRLTKATIKEIRKIAGKGLYVIEGCHDTQPGSRVLYIGQSGKNGLGERLGARILEGNGFGSAPGRLANRGRLWSTFWNITVRWAAVSNAEVGDLERLLIQAHLPPLNSHEIRGFHKGLPGLVVLNAGAKGPLLPCVVSDYYTGELWDGSA